MGCEDKDHVCACGNRLSFVCLGCRTKETFRTGETGYRAVAHILAQATERGWMDYVGILDGTLCPECTAVYEGEDIDVDDVAIKAID